MPRIPLITQKEQLAPEFHEHYDRLAARRGSIVGPFRVLLHSPELAVRAGEIGAFLRFDGSLPRDVAEIIILTAAREMDARYVWGDHTALGRQAGVREGCIQAIGATTADGITHGLSPEEAELVEYVQELVRTNRVSDAKSKGLESRLGLAGLVELTATIAYYRALACVLNTYQIDADAGKDVLPNS